MVGTKTLPALAAKSAVGAGKNIVSIGKRIANTGKSVSNKHKQLKSYDEQAKNVLQGNGQVYDIMTIAQQLEDISKQKTKYIAQQGINTLQSVTSKAAGMFGGVTNLFTPDAEHSKSFMPTMVTRGDSDGYISDGHSSLDYDNVANNLVTKETKDVIMKDSREDGIDVKPGELFSKAIGNMDKTNEPSAFRKSLEQATAELGDMIKKNGEKDIDFFDKDQTYGYI